MGSGELSSVVIVGAGHAGVEAVESLRRHGYGGRLVLVGEEPHLPYQRPGLSKELLRADGPETALPLRGRDFYDEHRVDLRFGKRVVRIDRPHRLVHLDDGAALSYDRLVLATGATPRELDLPGAGLTGVHRLHTWADASRLRTALAESRSAVVVGAGFIGLELAAAARARGIEVTVIERADLPLARATSPDLGAHLLAWHEAAGTRFALGAGVASLVPGRATVRAVRLDSGEEIACDLVVVGIGARARCELASQAGLATADGIVVDRRLATSDPAIFAIGDCARFPGEDDQELRLESVQCATDQARHLGRTLLGDEAAYDAVPWFWSTQGALRLQIAGLRRPGDLTVTTGDPGADRFSVHSFRDNRLVAVESVNRPADHVAARRVLASEFRPNSDQIADPAFELRAFARDHLAV